MIEELLNTYKNHDVLELENIRILEVKNFNKFGGLVPIVNLFGGKDKYLNIISSISNTNNTSFNRNATCNVYNKERFRI